MRWIRLRPSLPEIGGDWCFDRQLAPFGKYSDEDGNNGLLHRSDISDRDLGISEQPFDENPSLKCDDQLASRVLFTEPGEFFEPGSIPAHIGRVDMLPSCIAHRRGIHSTKSRSNRRPPSPLLP